MWQRCGRLAETMLLQAHNFLSNIDTCTLTSHITQNPHALLCMDLT